MSIVEISFLELWFCSFKDISVQTKLKININLCRKTSVYVGGGHVCDVCAEMHAFPKQRSGG